MHIRPFCPRRLIHVCKSWVSAPVPESSCADPAFLPLSSCIDVVTYANQAYLPTSSFIDIVPNCGKSPLSSGCLPYAAGYAAIFGAPCKVLSISNIVIFRVTKIPTLKMVKCLLLSYLQVALYVSS